MPVSRRQEPIAPPPIDREITVSEGITVKELSEKLGIKANLVIKKLVERKIFATINQNLDVKMAEEIAREFGASTNKVSFEEESTQEIELAEESSDRVRRAPVVTIMGHVDHGKTSLLDAIRSTNVADREAGGITQHIGAYHIEKNGRKIVFIDTPGHEAFTRMRARGAKVTDIVVLVVAADDGVMPQTLEAIDHAKAAGVPIIVAINKIDKGDAQPERVKQQLADRGLLAEDWGGDTVMVPVSAKAKTNLDLLLEMILLVADMQDLKANPDRPAVGTVLEAELDRGRGPVATVIVRNGTLRVGDYFICGSVFGKVRAMFDDRGQPIREAEPSMPAEVLGLDALPDVGDTFQVVTDTAKAKQIVLYRESKARDVAMQKTGRITLEQLHEQLKEGEVKELNIILKTDVSGTAEVISDMMQKLSNDKVRIRVLHSGVGAINETDVLLASASNAIIVGFNVRPERNADRAGRAGKSRHPPAHHHLRADRRAEARHDRHARAGLQRGVPGPRRGPRGLPHQQGRQCGRLHGVGRLHQARQRNAPAARQRGGLHRQNRIAAALQERRQRGQERIRMRVDDPQFRGHQASRHCRGLRHPTRGR